MRPVWMVCIFKYDKEHDTHRSRHMRIAVRITDVERRTDTTLVTLSCGHVDKRNQIYTYTIGAKSHCPMCELMVLAAKVDLERGN